MPKQILANSFANFSSESVTHHLSEIKALCYCQQAY